MAEFFISYSRADQPVVDPLVDRLRSIFGYSSVWLDTRDILPGSQWLVEIEEAIKGCPLFIYLLSSDSVNSPNCQHEYSIAKKQNRVILPIKIRRISDSELPEDILEYQFTDLSAGIRNNEEQFYLLLRSINRLRDQQQTFKMLSDIVLPATSPGDEQQFNLNILYYGDQNERIRALRELRLRGKLEVKLWGNSLDELKRYNNLSPDEQSAIPPDERPKTEYLPPGILSLIGLLFDEDITIATESLLTLQDWGIVTYIPSLLSSIVITAASTANSGFQSQAIQFIDQVVADVLELEKYRNVLDMLGGEDVSGAVSDIDERLAIRKKVLKAAEVTEKARSIGLYIDQQLHDLIVDYAVDPKTDYLNKMEKRLMELEASSQLLQLYRQAFVILDLDNDIIQLIDALIGDNI